MQYTYVVSIPLSMTPVAVGQLQLVFFLLLRCELCMHYEAFSALSIDAVGYILVPYRLVFVATLTTVTLLSVCHICVM